MSHPDVPTLERQLREARALYDEVPVAPDAWQRNQELVASADGAERRRTMVAVAAGVVALLVVALGWLVAGGRDQAADVPGSGGGGSGDSSSGEIADPVELARVELRDGTLVLEAGLDRSADRPDEPFLCDRLRQEGSTASSETSAGGCTPKVDRADLPGVTVDYLTGGTGDTRSTLTGAVDAQAAALTMWLADGTRADLDLVPMTGSDLRAFGHLTTGPVSVRPVRLVAWADAEKQQVLESVDVVDRFDLGWLPGEKGGCAGVQQTPDATFPGGTTVRASFVDAEVTFTGTGGGTRSVCRSMTEAPAAVVRTGDELVMVLAPEVAAVRLRGSGSLGPSSPVQPVGTSVWRATVRTVSGLADGDRLEFVDASGAVLQTLPVAWII